MAEMEQPPLIPRNFEREYCKGILELYTADSIREVLSQEGFEERFYIYYKDSEFWYDPEGSIGCFRGCPFGTMEEYQAVMAFWEVVDAIMEDFPEQSILDLVSTEAYGRAVLLGKAALRLLIENEEKYEACPDMPYDDEG